MIRGTAALFRLRLALLNGITAVGGYILFPDPPQATAVVATFAGVTVLAAGSSALNQVQERNLDLLMTRTRHRPLPRGLLTAGTAAGLGCLCTIAGLCILALAGGLIPVLLGGAAVFWYLAVYTPLKRRTSLALAAGALCGALPPVIGWSLAGGNPADFRIALLAGLLFLWQIPHFWLFQRRHEQDYRHAGFAVAGIEGRSGPAVLSRLWIFALLPAAMLLPAFGLVGGPEAVVFAGCALLPSIVAAQSTQRGLFFCLNLFPLLVTIMLFVRK